MVSFSCSVACVVAFSTAGVPAVDSSARHNYRPGDGYVPDKTTAIRIALAVWEPIDGSKAIANERLYHAVLYGGVWTVKGSPPRSAFGGVAVAEIRKSDGCVLRVSHGQ